MQVQDWFCCILLGILDVTTLCVELAGAFCAFSFNVNTTVSAVPLGAVPEEAFFGWKHCRHLKP